MLERNENVNRGLAFVAGAMIGAGIALVLAPQSGRKTRRLIRTRSRQVQAEMSRWLADVGDDVSEKLDETVEIGRTWSDARAKQVRQALETARDQIREQVSRIVGA